jgi:hypothetical protein
VILAERPNANSSGSLSRGSSIGRTRLGTWSAAFTRTFQRPSCSPSNVKRPPASRNVRVSSPRVDHCESPSSRGIAVTTKVESGVPASSTTRPEIERPCWSTSTSSRSPARTPSARAIHAGPFFFFAFALARSFAESLDVSVGFVAASLAEPFSASASGDAEAFTTNGPSPSPLIVNCPSGCTSRVWSRSFQRWVSSPGSS